MKKLIVSAVVILIMASCSQNEKQVTKEILNSTTQNIEKMEKIAKEQIERLLIEYKETLNTSSAEKATALYTKDGMFMPTEAPTAIGHEQIKASYTFIFSQIQLNVEFYIEEIQVEENLAFATTSSKGSVLIHANGQTISEENRELFVFEKENGSWKIARYMFNKTK